LSFGELKLILIVFGETNCKVFLETWSYRGLCYI